MALIGARIRQDKSSPPSLSLKASRWNTWKFGRISYRRCVSLVFCGGVRMYQHAVRAWERTALRVLDRALSPRGHASRFCFVRWLLLQLQTHAPLQHPLPPYPPITPPPTSLQALYSLRRWGFVFFNGRTSAMQMSDIQLVASGQVQGGVLAVKGKLWALAQSPRGCCGDSCGPRPARLRVWARGKRRGAPIPQGGSRAHSRRFGRI
jgi:hypothetical protein